MTTTTAEVATGDLRSTALDLIHDYTDPQGVNRRAERLHAANQATFATMRAANADFEHLIAFSEDYDDILQAALAAVDSVRLFTAAEKIGAELRKYVADSRANKPVYDDDATRPALDFLHAQMLELMATVRAQEPALKGISTPREVLRGGGAAQDAWEVLEQMLERYERIRSVQREITVPLSGLDQGPMHVEQLNRSGHLAAALDYEQFWIEWRVAARRSEEPQEGELKFLSWLRRSQHADFPRKPGDVFPDGRQMDYLRWLSDGDKAWVPSVAELERVDRLAVVMLSGTYMSERVEAKQDYFDHRGLKPRPIRKGEL